MHHEQHHKDLLALAAAAVLRVQHTQTFVQEVLRLRSRQLCPTAARLQTSKGSRDIARLRDKHIFIVQLS